MLIPYINGKGIQASAVGTPLDVQLGRRGAEAKNLGPESSIPFIMLYLTNSIANLIFSLTPFLALHPTLGRNKSGAQTPRTQKLGLRNSVAHT